MSTVAKAIRGQDVCEHYRLTAGQWSGLSLAERALFRMAYATDVLEVQEIPHGSNDSPIIRRWLGLCGIEEPAPWCVAAIAAQLIDSGADKRLLPLNPASVESWHLWADEKGILIPRPKRACVGLLWNPDPEHHRSHGFMVSGLASSKVVNTLEANTNTDGSREGYGMFRREREIARVDHWIDLGWLV